MERCICIKQSPKMCLKSPGGAGRRNGHTEQFYAIMVCLSGTYYLFTQLLRATGILFEVIPLIFLPPVDALFVVKVAIAPL